MIAAKNSIHILALGVNPQEKSILSQLVKSQGGNIEIAKDDMDLWGLTQNGHFDVCVLGQTKQMEDPCYLVWLLRGVIPKARIVVIYDELNAHETKRLQSIQATHVLVRPIQVDQFARHFDEACQNQIDDGAVNHSMLSRFNPSHILSWLK